MDGKQLQSQYKDHLSDYKDWDQKEHAQDYILYPKNIGYRLCIDETALSRGELYTIIINKDRRGRKGSIAAVIKGTKAEDIIAVLMLIAADIRFQVKEISTEPFIINRLSVCKGVSGCSRIIRFAYTLSVNYRVLSLFLDD